jgi:hypothetical protein
MNEYICLVLLSPGTLENKFFIIAEDQTVLRHFLNKRSNKCTCRQVTLLSLSLELLDALPVLLDTVSIRLKTAPS